MEAVATAAAPRRSSSTPPLPPSGSNAQQQIAKRRKVATGKDDMAPPPPSSSSSHHHQQQQQHFAVSPAEDDAVIRQRLLTRTTTTRGEPPLKKLLKKFFAFYSEVEKENPSNIPECDKLYRAFLQELSSFELPLLKTKVVIDANRREQESFKELQAELAQKIRNAQIDIEDLKVQLEESKIERQHKEECEAIRRLIGAQPARSETQQVLDELSKELSALEAENLGASRTLELRKKQFSLLLHVVDDLQSTIEDELKVSAEDSRIPSDDLKVSVVDKVPAEQEKPATESNASAEAMQIEQT